MAKCSNPKCSFNAKEDGFCSSGCRIAASLGSPEGRRVRSQPKPPAVADVVRREAETPIRSALMKPLLQEALKPVAGIPVSATHPNGDPKLPPLWMRKELAMKTPMVLERNLPMAELMAKFQRAKDYNRTMPGHQTTEDQWKLWLVRSGYDPKLSRHVFPSLAS